MRITNRRFAGGVETRERGWSAVRRAGLCVAAVAAAIAWIWVGECAEDYRKHLEKGIALSEECRHREEEALAEVEKAYRMNPNDFETRYWYGRTLYDNRRFGEAAGVLESALSQRPDDVKANAYLAYSYGRIGENLLKRTVYMFKSTRQIKKVLDIDPNFADAYFSLAIGCTYLGWYEKPTGVFRQLVKLVLEDEELVDTFSAEALYFKAISLDPDNAWYYVQLGWLYLKQNKPDKARKEFEKAMALAEKDVKCGMKDDTVPRGIAVYYEDAQMFEEGLRYAKTALRWNPEDLCLEPRLSIGRVIDRLEEEVRTGKAIMKDVADEM
ncbi:MAG: tetratricopeptide repeat protein [bacterium]